MSGRNDSLLFQVSCGKAMGRLAHQQKAKILLPGRGGLNHAFAENTERVFPPQSIVAERIANPDSDDAVAPFVPDARDIAWFEQNRTGEDNTEVDEEINGRVGAEGRHQLVAAQFQQNSSEFPDF